MVSSRPDVDQASLEIAIGEMQSLSFHRSQAPVGIDRGKGLEPSSLPIPPARGRRRDVVREQIEDGAGLLPGQVTFALKLADAHPGGQVADRERGHLQIAGLHGDVAGNPDAPQPAPYAVRGQLSGLALHEPGDRVEGQIGRGPDQRHGLAVGAKDGLAVLGRGDHPGQQAEVMRHRLQRRGGPQPVAIGREQVLDEAGPGDRLDLPCLGHRFRDDVDQVVTVDAGDAGFVVCHGACTFRVLRTDRRECPTW